MVFSHVRFALRQQRDRVLERLKVVFEDDELEERFLIDYWLKWRRVCFLACLFSQPFCIFRIAMGCVWVFIGNTTYLEKYQRIYSFTNNGDESCSSAGALVLGIICPLLDLMSAWAGLYFARNKLTVTVPHCIASLLPNSFFSAKSDVEHIQNLRPNVLSIGSFYHATAAVLIVIPSTARLVSGPGAVDVCSMEQLFWVVSTYPLMLRFRFIHTFSFVAMVFAILVGKSVVCGIVCEAGPIVIFSCCLMPILVFSMWQFEISERRRFLATAVSREHSNLLRDAVNLTVPPHCADFLLRRGFKSLQQEAHGYSDVTLLFIEFGHSREAPDARVYLGDLNTMFAMVDGLLDRIGSKAFKVETNGACYVVASGVPIEESRHAHVLLDFSIAVDKIFQGLSWAWPGGGFVEVRQGLHSGSLFGGIAGRFCPRFRLFGDTVNLTRLMLSKSKPGSPVLSSATAMSLGVIPKDGVDWKRGDVVDTITSLDGSSDAKLELVRLICRGVEAVKDREGILTWDLKVPSAGGSTQGLSDRDAHPIMHAQTASENVYCSSTSEIGAPRVPPPIVTRSVGVSALEIKETLVRIFVFLQTKNVSDKDSTSIVSVFENASTTVFRPWLGRFRDANMNHIFHIHITKQMHILRRIVLLCISAVCIVKMVADTLLLEKDLDGLPCQRVKANITAGLGMAIASVSIGLLSVQRCHDS